jgi:predicted nucleic acid-binding protein
MLFVDTSVWSLAFRRDHPPDAPSVTHLREELVTGEAVTTTGIVLQELLQGIRGPKQRTRLLELFEPIAFVDPERRPHPCGRGPQRLPAAGLTDADPTTPADPVRPRPRRNVS